MITWSSITNSMAAISEAEIEAAKTSLILRFGSIHSAAWQFDMFKENYRDGYTDAELKVIVDYVDGVVGFN